MGSPRPPTYTLRMIDGPGVRPRTGWWRRESATPLGVVAAGLAALVVTVKVVWWLVDTVSVALGAPIIEPDSIVPLITTLVLASGALAVGLVAADGAGRRHRTQLPWVGVGIGAYSIVKGLSDPVAVLWLQSVGRDNRLFDGLW